MREETQANINVSSAKYNLSVIYLQVLQIHVSNGDVSVKVNALLDSGSGFTLVTKILADKLRLEAKSQTLTFFKRCLLVDQNNIKTCKSPYFSQSYPSKISISNASIVENLDLLRFKINKNTIKKEWKHIQDLPTEVDNPTFTSAATLESEMKQKP